jgi:hypothetical protein
MPGVAFEPSTPVFEPANTVLALYLATNETVN